MNSKIEIPIPPTTLPLLHDAMCTIICSLLETIGPPKKIEITYDEVKGLRKIIIENNVKLMLSMLDDFFGGPKLKPSAKIGIDHWSYGLDANRKLAYLHAGSNKLPRYTGVRRMFMNIFEKQCYSYAKGQYFIPLREEGKKLKPIAGHLEIGIDGGIAVMFNRALKHFSYTLRIQRERYTAYVLLGDIPSSHSIISDIVNYLYTINYENKTIEVNRDNIRKVLTPYDTLNIMLEAPDLAYYNLLFKILHDYSKGTVDIVEWPPIRIYVYPGGYADVEKTVVAFFNITPHDYSSLSKALEMLRIKYNLSVSKVANIVNSAISKLSNIVKASAKREEASRALETLIPSLRMFVSKLASGILDVETLYDIARKLIGFESIDRRFSDVAEILTGIL